MRSTRRSIPRPGQTDSAISSVMFSYATRIAVDLPRDSWQEIRDDALSGIRQRKSWNEGVEREKKLEGTWKLKSKLKVSYRRYNIAH